MRIQKYHFRFDLEGDELSNVRFRLPRENSLMMSDSRNPSNLLSKNKNSLEYTNEIFQSGVIRLVTVEKTHVKITKRHITFMTNVTSQSYEILSQK